MANLVLLLAIVGAALAAPSVIVDGSLLLTSWILAALSGERRLEFARRTRFVVLFAIVLFAAQALSIRTGDAVLSGPIRITEDGLLSGARMALRFLVILSASALFVRTTDPDRLAQGLIRAGVPYRFGYLVILALRFVPFFENEMRLVREAQRVRGIEVSPRSLRRIGHAVRYTFVPVIVSGLHRVDSIAISMKGRCFGLHPKRTTSRENTRSGWSLAALAVGGGAVALAAISIHWRWI